MRIFQTERFVKENEKQGDIPNFTKVTKDVMKIVWPSMVEGFLVALVTMFDGIMVSSIGNNANSAVTITKQPIFFYDLLYNRSKYCLDCYCIKTIWGQR